MIAQHEPRQAWHSVSWKYATVYTAMLLAAGMGRYDRVVYHRDRMEATQALYMRAAPTR